ncbi:MAG: hypothetical protein AAGC60_21140 [Acidobacteriota bacterium]
MLEIFDPLLSRLASNVATLLKLPEVQTKSSLMAASGSLFGVVVMGFAVGGGGVTLPESFGRPWMGAMVLGLVIGGGSEGANTLTKYFDYVKQGRKQSLETAIEIVVDPTTAAVAAGQTFQFEAVVKNAADRRLQWTVAHGGGGTITSDGLYTAPDHAGTFRIIAKSVADPTKYATATVTVSQ